MIIIDAQLSSHLTPWIKQCFGIDVFSAAYLGLKTAKDSEIFSFAREKNAIVITKDNDFVELQDRLDPPPKIIWLTLGNTSNANLKEILNNKLLVALQILDNEKLVEIASSN